MFTDFLIKKFVSNSNDEQDLSLRNRYGTFAGVMGIIINTFLFCVKFFIGLLTGSIAISADSFNNLSDATSSIITIIGFKLSSKPADAEHPFGHGRIEYISALIVAFLVMLVGLKFIKSSFYRIINPEPIVFEFIPFILLVISISLKWWLSTFNKYIGIKINSSALKASATDALGDVFTSTTVAISFLLSKFTSLPLDGYIGIIVASVIVYSGYNIIKETLNPLLGEAPDIELVNEINNSILSYEHITGVHDLIVHNYGPGRIMASIHAEIPANLNIMTIHNIIDRAERETSKKLNIYLVIHMDPICTEDKKIQLTKDLVENILKNYKEISSMHDFRFVGENESKNLIFDIVVTSSNLDKNFNENTLCKDISSDIKKVHPNYNCIITVDYEF